MLWLQPLRIPVAPLLFMGFKLALVGALTLSLLTRCRELSAAQRVVVGDPVNPPNALSQAA
jgi:hypothetical protein